MEPKIKIARICSYPPCENEIPKNRRKFCSNRCRLRISSSKYYYKHKKKRLKYQKKYYEKNKEKDKERRKAYYKGWYERNREKHNTYMRNYMKENKRIKSKNV